MKITAVVFRGESRNEFLTYVDVVFNGVFVVKGMKIIKRKSEPGLILSMPCHKTPAGTYIDIAHPIREEFRSLLEGHIFGEYEKYSRVVG